MQAPPAPSHSLRQRAVVHAALGDPIRLAIVDALRLSDRSPADLAALCSTGSNLLAHHLDVLERAGLIERLVSHGDRRRRYVRLRTSQLDTLLSPPRLPARGVLFVCTRNSVRSPLAAALWNAVSPTPATSAGIHPADCVHPRAVAAARRAGLDLGAVRPRHRDEVTEPVDLIVTVCDQAREGTSAASQLLALPSLHWSIADPAATGTQAAFDRALRLLRGRIEVLARSVVPAR